jgi:hypothetical protein
MHLSPLLTLLDIISGLNVHLISSFSSDVYLFLLYGMCSSYASTSSDFFIPHIELSKSVEEPPEVLIILSRRCLASFSVDLVR